MTMSQSTTTKRPPQIGDRPEPYQITVILNAGSFGEAADGLAVAANVIRAAKTPQSIHGRTGDVGMGGKWHLTCTDPVSQRIAALRAEADRLEKAARA